MAIDAMSAIEEAGLRIPEDIAVVGFEDIEFARLLTPSLTTIRQNRGGLAGAAVEALLKMLERPEEAPPVSIMPVDLVVRESTGRERSTLLGSSVLAPESSPLSDQPV